MNTAAAGGTSYRVLDEGACRDAPIRWTASAVEPPTSIIAMFAPSTPSAESAVESSPSGMPGLQFA